MLSDSRKTVCSPEFKLIVRTQHSPLYYTSYSRLHPRRFRGRKFDRRCDLTIRLKRFIVVSGIELLGIKYMAQQTLGRLLIGGLPHDA